MIWRINFFWENKLLIFPQYLNFPHILMLCLIQKIFESIFSVNSLLYHWKKDFTEFLREKCSAIFTVHFARCMLRNLLLSYCSTVLFKRFILYQDALFFTFGTIPKTLTENFLFFGKAILLLLKKKSSFDNFQKCIRGEW